MRRARSVKVFKLRDLRLNGREKVGFDFALTEA